MSLTKYFDATKTCFFELPEGYINLNNQGNGNFEIVPEDCVDTPDWASIRLIAKADVYSSNAEAKADLENFKDREFLGFSEDAEDFEGYEIQFNHGVEQVIAYVDTYLSEHVITVIFNVGSYNVYITLNVTERMIESKRALGLFLGVVGTFQVASEPMLDYVPNVETNFPNTHDFQLVEKSSVDISDQITMLKNNLIQIDDLEHSIYYNGFSIRFPSNFISAYHTCENNLLSAHFPERQLEDGKFATFQIDIMMESTGSQDIVRIFEKLQSDFSDSEARQVSVDSCNGLSFAFNSGYRNIIRTYFYKDGWMFTLVSNSSFIENFEQITFEIMETIEIEDVDSIEYAMTERKDTIAEGLFNKEFFTGLDYEKLGDQEFQSGGRVYKSVRYHILNEFTDFLAAPFDLYLPDEPDSGELLRLVKGIRSDTTRKNDRFNYKEYLDESRLSEHVGKLYFNIVNIIDYSRYRQTYLDAVEPVVGGALKYVIMAAYKSFKMEVNRTSQVEQVVEKYTKIISNILRSLFCSDTNLTLSDAFDSLGILGTTLTAIDLSNFSDETVPNQYVISSRLSRFIKLIGIYRDNVNKDSYYLKNGKLNGLQFLELLSKDVIRIPYGSAEYDVASGKRTYYSILINNSYLYGHPELALNLSEIYNAIVEFVVNVEQTLIINGSHRIVDELFYGENLSLYSFLALFADDDAKLFINADKELLIELNDRLFYSKLAEELKTLINVFFKAILEYNGTNFDEYRIEYSEEEQFGSRTTINVNINYNINWD